MDKLQLIKNYLANTSEVNDIVKLSLIVLAEFWFSVKIIDETEYNDIISEINLGRTPTLDELINNAIYSAKQSEYIELFMIQEFLSDCLYKGKITRGQYNVYMNNLLS